MISIFIIESVLYTLYLLLELQMNGRCSMPLFTVKKEIFEWILNKHTVENDKGNKEAFWNDGTLVEA